MSLDKRLQERARTVDGQSMAEKAEHEMNMAVYRGDSQTAGSFAMVVIASSLTEILDLIKEEQAKRAARESK